MDAGWWTDGARSSRSRRSTALPSVRCSRRTSTRRAIWCAAMTDAATRLAAEEANRAGRECVDCAGGLARDIARLESTPATLADIIQKRVRGIGVHHHEQVLARAQAILAR